MLQAPKAAIKADQPVSDGLETLIGKQNPVVGMIGLIALGPIYFTVFAGHWERLRFSQRLRRTLSAMHDGQTLATALNQHMSRWLSRGQRLTLEIAERENQLSDVIAALAEWPTQQPWSSTGILFYAANLYLAHLAIIGVTIRLSLAVDVEPKDSPALIIDFSC